MIMHSIRLRRPPLSLKKASASAFCLALAVLASAQGPPPTANRSAVGSQGPLPVHKAYTAEQIEAGGSLFQQNCAFCHGRDAAGGETGPDLTRSKLVTADATGSNIEEIVKSGRIDKGMPKFNLPDAEINNLAAFIHSQQDKAMSQSGNRRGVEAADLQTGDVEAGKRYFNGPGNCSKCHAATGDLAGVATRFEGLKLEQRMLYPRDVKAKVTVTDKGKTFNGTLVYQDEFMVALVDSNGIYHSWKAGNVTAKVDNPVQAHVDQFEKYTDADIHNLMKYIQTLR